MLNSGLSIVKSKNLKKNIVAHFSGPISVYPFEKRFIGAQFPDAL